ncbi:MAG: MarP family serine protease [Actinomycetota bacterium]|nr:MarP family serine protease [Actinomycetota bacterium]
MSADPIGMLSRSVTEVLASDLTGLDLVLLAVAALIALGGLRTGLLARAAAWAGLIAGLALSGRTVPAALAVAEGAGLPARTFLAVLTLTATVSISSIGLQAVTAPIRRLLTLGPLSVLDRALGAVASVVAFTLLLWLLIPTAAAVPGRVSSEVRASSVLGTLDAATPPQPDVGRALRTLLGGERFPDVFATLAPTPEPSAPPTTIGIAPEVLARAITASTSVRVVGCGRSYSGSGFAIDPEHIVTNAHVVAGARELHLQTHDGRRVAAEVVVFDKDRDLALLHAPAHGLDVLELGRAEVGDVTAVVGYPGGQAEHRVASARIDRWVTGVGRDIYGRDATERSLFFLASELRSGDSGAAVIDTSGDVVAVVFAISPDVSTVAYALAIDEVETLLASPRVPGDAGRCV